MCIKYYEVLYLDCIFIFFHKVQSINACPYAHFMATEKPGSTIRYLYVYTYFIIYACDLIYLIIPFGLYVYMFDQYVSKRGITVAINRTLNRLIYYLYLLLEIMIN